MPLDRKAWSDYGAELEQQAADAKKAAEAKPQEDGGGFLTGIAERQAEQGSDLSGEIEAEEKDYTDEEIKEQASAFQHLAKATADNVMEKLENNRTAAVYHDILEDAWQTEQDFAEAGIETHGTAVTEEDVAKAKARVNEEPLWSAAAKEAGREFIAAYADNPNSAMQSAAQGLRRTDTNIAYWMTPEERLSKAKEIEEATGINAMALLGDNEAFRSALNIYDHQQKILALRRQKGETENTSAVMAEVYKEFPGLEKLSYEDPAAAALALHDIHHVREARDTITAWKEAWNYGWLEQEYGILKDKEADGKASENDKARMAALEEQLKTEPVTPSFFEAPWLTAISGLAGSMPMMTDALTEGALWGVAGAAVGAAVSAPAGGVGAVPGFFTGGARGMVRALGRHALGRGIASGFTWGRRIGELNSMYKAQRGQDFAEYQKMTDEYGERLLSDEEAARYSQVSGAAKAAVEVAPMELFLSKFKSSPQAQKVFQRIIEQGEMDRAFRRDVLRTVTGRGKDIAEVTLAEAGEEGVQQAIGDIAHNQIEIDTGDTNQENGGVFTPEEIMARGAMATMAALPTSFLFGLIPAAASTGWDGWRFSKLGKDMEKFRQAYSAEERQTMARTVVLAELQQVTQDSRLKETSPETQRKLLREELAGTGLEVAYIDTALAQEQENGIEDIRKAGRAAGLSDEAIEDTVEAGGILAVPVECYAQSAASPELLDAVSFSAEAEPMGRMKARAEAFYEEAKARLKTTVERQKRLEETITKELFPSEGEERAMAVEAMTLNPENPAQGWREIERELSRAREDELKEADEAIRKGLPKDGQTGAAWYEAWKKEHGRAPKEAEIEEMIYALATGAEDTPKVEGFNQSAKAANVRMVAKERLTEIDHKRKVLESIKERMMSLTGKEMQETETLTGEGFRVYRSILSDLKSADNPRVTRAARIGALLFARHADIYAAAMRRRGGEFENYTAMDYYNKAFALDVSGRAKGDGAFYQEAANAQTAAERLKEDAKAWKETLKAAWAGRLTETQMFRVMETPLVLQLVGAKALPIYMSQGKLMKIKKEHPEIKKALLNKLPEQLADPMMIFQSKTVPGRIVVCLELKDEAGVNVVVPVELNAKQDRMEINVITSIYGKGKPTTGSNYGWFADNVLKGNTIYINKKQAANFYRAAGLQLPMEGRKFNDLFGLSIKTETDLVKEKMKNPALYQETHGETTMLENGRRIVSLFKSADESTFLHELGHVFLDDLRQLAAFDEVSQKELATVDAWTAWYEGAAKEYQDTPWAAEFRGYEAAILKAQKAGDSAALEKALTVWRHERFARAFERYLKEGEAPARGLKQVFRKFAAFLRAVYRAFTSDGGRASAEVEQIMDRMIATDEEIEAAALDKRYQDITEAGGETLFNETEKETYQRWYEKAKAEAKERLARVVERKMKGDLRRKMEAEIQSEEERYQEALYQDTIQQARQAVKLAGDEKAALLFYENIEAYREADKKVPAMETLLKEHMEAYRREKEQELLASAITPEEVERAMASSEYHDRRLALEAAAFQRQAEALRRVGGRTRAAMDEVEEKIEGLAEEPGAEEIEAQKEAVRQKYQGTDMWMKAPNGQPTKLTEEDWLLVRTPAFKAWFGDWEAEYRKQENIERGIRAVEEVLHTRQDVQKAMFRSETGGIDFVYGEEGDPSKKYAGGYGIAHILAKHGQSAIDMIPTVIAKGKATQKHNDRIHFNYGGYTAVVRLDFDGNQKTWLVTNFEKYANKKDSPTAEVFARSADNPDGAHSTIGGNLSLAPTIAQKKVDGQAVSKVVDENGEPLLSGDKKAAVREFKKRISGSKEVIYWKGQSGHSRPSSETWASTLNAKLHPSGKLSIADEGEKSKGAETNRKGKAEEEAAKAKEPEGWRDLMRAIHRLRAAHRWGAEELSAIDTVAKAANKVDMKTAWAKVKALLTKAHVNEQELKEAVRGKSQLYRELARKELSAMPLSEATATLTYRRQEIEAARRVEKLVKAEKWEMAEKEKENQLLAAAMAAEARKTREKVDVIRRRVERYLKGKEKLPPSEGYWLHHLAYLLRLTEKDAAKPAKLDTLAAIAAKLSAGLDIRTEGEWTPLSAAMALSASPAENGYLGMTMEDFEEAARGLDILYVTGRDEGKMKTMAGRTLEEIRDEIISDPTNLLDGVTVKENKINPNEGGLGYSTLLRKAPLLGQQMASAGQRYLAATMKPELMMELLGEKAHRYLYGTLERAAQHEAAMTAEAMATVNHLVGAYTRKERQAWQERNILWWGDEKISKENILAMALNLGNEINRSRLAEGLSDLGNPHIIEEIIARIEQHMTEKDWQFVQGVWDFLGKYWPETVRIEMMMNGTQLHPQPALPFTARTKDGKEIKMKGGYYPIVYNAEKSDRALEYSLDEEAKKNMQGAAALSTGLSSTKSRTQGAVKGRPLLLSLRVIPKHLGEVIHNQTHRIACRDVYHIIHDKTFSDYVTKRMGAPFYENLKQWAIDVWQTKSADLNQAERGLSKLMQGLRSNAALAIMGWRMWPVTENATNIFPAMNEIGAAEMMSAVGDFYANFGTYKELLHKSLFMSSRIEHMDRDMKRQHRMFETDAAVPEWLKDNAYLFMEKTDLMFSAPLWCRAYKNAFAPKLAEVMAENEAVKKEIEAAYAEDKLTEAKVYDLVQRQKEIEAELTRRRHGAPLAEETPLSRTPKAELEAEAFRLNTAIAEAEREAAEKHRRFALVSERELKTPEEMNAEAEQRAIFAADRKVRNVFGSGDVKDLAAVQKGSELMKLFTMFYGYFSVQANAIIRSYYRGRSAKSWAPLASTILYRIFLTSALATLGRMMIFGEGDDDKDKYRKDAAGNKIEIPVVERILTQYAKNTLSTATGMAVGVRDIGNFYINMVFEGTDYGRGLALFGTAGSRAVQEVNTLSKLLMAREEVNEKADLAEAKRKARYDKMTERQKKKFDEEAKYRRPPRRIGWLDIARSAAMTGTYLTANKLGVTDTMTNAVFSTMQYIWDDDGRYDASLRNMLIRSAIFGKKPIKRVIPEKPKKEEKRRRRRTR
jgi:hypothetical protein